MKKKCLNLVLITTILVEIIFSLTGCGKKNVSSDSNGTDSSNKNINLTDTMVYVAEEDKDYVLIDTAGNVKKLSKDLIGQLDYNTDTILYHNSMLTKKENKYILVDFNGNKIYESEKRLSLLVNNKDKTLYQYKDENGKYGVIDSSAKVVVPAEYDGIHNIATNFNYFYSYTDNNKNDNKNKYIITIFNSDGKKVYESDCYDNLSYYDKDTRTTDNGISVLNIRKDENTVIVLNLNTGEVIQTINATKDYTVSLYSKGNALEVTWYKGSTYGNRDDKKSKYYWFGENEKVSKEIELAEDESLSVQLSTNYNKLSTSDSSSCTILSTKSENIAIDEYGKEFYKTNNLLHIEQYKNEKDGKVYTFLKEEIGRKSYKIINSEGKVILEKDISGIGNKYILAEKTLYKHDGTKYLDNVTSYSSLYDLEIIKTKEKMIIENSEGKQVEHELDYNSSVDNIKLIDEDTVAIKTNKLLTMINIVDLSIKTVDISSYKYVFLKDGYYEVRADSKRMYYNKNSELIYETKK